MALPSWQNGELGGKIRAALWLETEVTEGNIFTKADLRKAFPGDAQIDRRLRELRDVGWRIDTSRVDPSLRQEEQRYVTKGAEVWIPGKAKAAKHKNSLTAVQRAKVMQGDNFLCRTCGIAGSESYPDDPSLEAQLNVARRKVVLGDGTVDHLLVTECKRCGSGGEREVNLGELLDTAAGLSQLEKEVVLGWIADNQRKQGSLETFWGIYRTLPEPAREAIQRTLAGDDK